MDREVASNRLMPKSRVQSRVTSEIDSAHANCADLEENIVVPERSDGGIVLLTDATVNRSRILAR